MEKRIEAGDTITVRARDLFARGKIKRHGTDWEILEATPPRIRVMGKFGRRPSRFGVEFEAWWCDIGRNVDVVAVRKPGEPPAAACDRKARHNCPVVFMAGNVPRVCSCDCIDCKRAWFADGEPIVRDGKIVRRGGGGPCGICGYSYDECICVQSGRR